MKLYYKHAMLMLLFAATVSGNVFGQSIVFEPSDTVDWKEVMARVKELNRLIFIDAYSANSSVSKKMEQTTLADQEIVDRLNVAYINVHVNMDSADGIAFGKKFEINCIPAYLFIDRDGSTVIQRGTGFISAPDFKAMIQSIVDPSKGTFWAYENEYNSGNVKVADVLAYLKERAINCMATNDLAVKFLISKKEDHFVLPDFWQVIKLYVTDVESAPFKYLVSNRKAFIDKYGLDTVNAKIFDAYINGGKELAYKEKADKSVLNAYREKAGKVLFERSDELGLMLDWMNADATQNWKGYYNSSKDLIGKYKGNDAAFLNSVSSKLEANVKEKKYLKDALQWAQKSTEINQGWMNMDTYAKLLFKTGDKKQAADIETKAIDLAKANEVDTAPLIATLNFFTKKK